MKKLTPFFPFFLLIAFLFSTCIPKSPPVLSDTKPNQKLETLAPNIDCPTNSLRPSFSWTPWSSKLKNIKYQLDLVELKENQTADSAIKKNPKIISEKKIEEPYFRFPKSNRDLPKQSAFAYQVTVYEEAVSGKEKIISKSEVSLFYTYDPKLPPFINSLLCCENNIVEKTISNWKTAYGTPSKNEKSAGCLNSLGTVEMKGNRNSGDAVYQDLSSSSKIIKGNYYQISFCAKSYPKELDYIRFRFIAYNGILPKTGSHPAASKNIAVIGESEDIESEDWNRSFLVSWNAPKDYDHIAVLVVTNESSPSELNCFGSISNICIQVTDDCGFNTDNLGITKNGKTTAEIEKYIQSGTKPEEQEVNFSQGFLTDLFGSQIDETGNNTWYHKENDCISIGGEIPSDAKDLTKKYEQYKLPGGISNDIFEEGVKTIYNKIGTKIKYPDWKPVPAEKENDCRLYLDKSKPFEGRDIIYVHGLVLDHILKRTVANDQTGYLQGAASLVNFATATELDSVSNSWPDGEKEFFKNGYYHKKALSYFDEHITRYLGDLKNPSNRYMLVSYNSSQRLVENVHAALTQISLAMNEGIGVVYDEKDPRDSTCFGKEVVIITHSTGALLMDAALAIAGLSETDEAIQKSFGNVKYIADRTKVSISLHGAIAGSELAGLGVFGVNLAAVAATGADAGIDLNIAVDNAIETGQQMVFDAITGLKTAGSSNNTSVTEAFLDEVSDSIKNITSNMANTFNNSVLVDLSPTVAKLLWGDVINRTKVPVLTVAGGHPGGLSESIITKWLLPGFDDGVVSTNSQSASPTLIHPELYQYIPPESRIFDKGLDLRRSVPYFAEQSKGVLGSAYGSVPWLSPTGMVQPVFLVGTPSPRYANHYPFLQSTSEHMYSFSDSVSYTTSLGAPNIEECLVTENNYVFDNELVNRDIENLVQRNVKGQNLKITLRIPYFTFSLWPPPSITSNTFTMSWSIPLWRRTYDTLSGNDQEMDFVYKYVLR
jgi:hypothetical protein